MISRGGRPGIPAPNSPCGLCGREATIEQRVTIGWPLLAGEGGVEAALPFSSRDLRRGLLTCQYYTTDQRCKTQNRRWGGGLSGSEMGC